MRTVAATIRGRRHRVFGRFANRSLYHGRASSEQRCPTKYRVGSGEPHNKTLLLFTPKTVCSGRVYIYTRVHKSFPPNCLPRPAARQPHENVVCFSWNKRCFFSKASWQATVVYFSFFFFRFPTSVDEFIFGFTVGREHRVVVVM